MNKEHVSKLLGNIVGAEKVRIDEPMRNNTSFKLGGCADILVTPESIKELVNVYRACKDGGLPVFVMGNGTNLIVRDKGIRGVVVKIFDHLNRYTVAGDTIEAEAGMLLSKVSKIALENGLAGLEFAEGIPGTLGGAVVMNAGAYNGEMADVIVKTEFLDKEGNVHTVCGDQHQFGYRTSFMQKQEGIVLKSQMKLKMGNKEEIKASMDDFNKKRRDKQPLEMPSAGSVFKRPSGYYTGKLIEDSGLRGYRIGGAQVSTKHCGFIVNTGNATASDVIHLIRHIQTVIESGFGVKLETEVRIVGEE